MKLPKIHHLQLVLVGMGIGLLLGIVLSLFARGNGDALIVVAFIVLGILPMSVAVVGVIEGSQDSRQRIRELDAEQRKLKWRVVSPAWSKGFSRRRRLD